MPKCPFLSTSFNKSVKTLILTGVTFKIESETLYIVYVIDAISSWSSVEKSLIMVTEIRNDLNINNNEIFDEFTYVKYYANAE